MIGQGNIPTAVSLPLMPLPGLSPVNKYRGDNFARFQGRQALTKRENCPQAGCPYDKGDQCALIDCPGRNQKRGAA